MNKYFILLLLPFFVACKSAVKVPLTPDLERKVSRHIVAVDIDGEARWPLNPTENMDVISESIHIDEILKGLKAHPSVSINGKPTKKILIFIHGGLNSRKDAMNRSLGLYDQMGEYYPIFINWNSSLVSSYYDHLFHKRQGRHNQVWGYVTAPGIYLYDLMRAIVKSPITTIYQAKHEWTTYFVKDIFTENAERIHQQLLKNSKFPISPMYDQSKIPYTWKDTPLRLLTLWGKYLSSPGVDSFGTSAWDNMTASTEFMFRQRSEFDRRNAVEPFEFKSTKSGHVGRFFDLFQKHLHQGKKAGENYEITLVGHSMGTIVSNRILSQYPNLPYKHIVYMAAACTVKDVAVNVLPMLRRVGDLKFYALSLHTKSEMAEAPFYNLVPRGTLLVWLDTMFTRPATQMDRMFGRWENTMAAAHIIDEDIRPRVHLKIFGGPDTSAEENPHTHGAFGDFKFWLESFWDPNSKEKAQRHKRDFELVRPKDITGLATPQPRRR